MKSTELPASSLRLIKAAMSALKTGTSYTATAAGNKSAARIACDICCDLRDIGMDCHVAGDTIRYYAHAEECPDCHGTGVYRPVDGPPETCDHARATGNESADGRCPEQFFLEATWGELRACQNPTLQWAVLKYLNRHIPFCAIASPERIIWDDGSVFVPSDAKPLRETGGTL